MSEAVFINFLCLVVGLFAGGFLAYWFEDALREPIRRAYADLLYDDSDDLPPPGSLARDRGGIGLHGDRPVLLLRDKD